MARKTNECVSWIVRRDDWSKGHFERSAVAALEADQVLFRVDRFAFTSNNVTYAAAGDMLDYWGFFPADRGFGRIPVMGFADVVASRNEDVSKGERVFGFFPMATHLVIHAADVNAAQFIDGSAHRKDHAPVYRQYLRASADALYEADHEDRILLLRGLFFTSFLVDSFLADKKGFGAERYVVGSASSKTGIALAYLLQEQGRGRVIGVTSPRNRAFVEASGFYEQVIGYDEVDSLAADVPTAFIDHSGNGPFVSALHHRLGESLKHSLIVGATHWDACARPAALPGPEPSFFFAPGEVQKRIAAWGPTGFQERLGAGWKGFLASSERWLRVERSCGPEAVERVYREVLSGQARPDVGHVLSLWPA